MSWLYDQSGVFVLVLMLGPSEVNSTMEEINGKEDIIHLYDA